QSDNRCGVHADGAEASPGVDGPGPKGHRDPGQSLTALRIPDDLALDRIPTWRDPCDLDRGIEVVRVVEQDRPGMHLQLAHRRLVDGGRLWGSLSLEPVPHATTP